MRLVVQKSGGEPCPSCGQHEPIHTQHGVKLDVELGASALPGRRHPIKRRVAVEAQRLLDAALDELRDQTRRA